MEEFEMLSEEQIDNLFVSDAGEDTSESDKNKENPDNQEDNTTEINTEDLFTSEQSESGGSEEETKEEQDKEDTSSKETESSPKNNFYSSIANALVEDGVTPDLDTSKITDDESFAAALKDYIDSQLDETQKRINDALNNGVDTDTIKYYENSIKQLESIEEDALNAEDEKGESLRKNILYNDFINKGYTKEEAIEEIQEIIDNGSDVRKAKRALESLKTSFKRKYQDVLDEAKETARKEEEALKKQSEDLKKDILENTKAFGDLEISKEDRKKAFDIVSKPVWKDPETGVYYTELQRYQKEHNNEFIKNLGLLYVLTDKFTKLDNLVKPSVKKNTRKAIKDLENTINNTRRTSDGDLHFTGGFDEDPESVFKGYTIDV